jgi:hypothetical protein
MFPNCPAVQHSLFDTDLISDEIDFPDKLMDSLVNDSIDGVLIHLKVRILLCCLPIRSQVTLLYFLFLLSAAIDLIDMNIKVPLFPLLMVTHSFPSSSSIRGEYELEVAKRHLHYRGDGARGGYDSGLRNVSEEAWLSTTAPSHPTKAQYIFSRAGSFHSLRHIHPLHHQQH